MTKTYAYATTLEVISCGNCGIPFGLPVDLAAARREDGGSFYCPNGHFVGWAETEAKRLARELRAARDRTAAWQARAEGAEASLRTTKGHVTRLRRQVLAGECPFCGQHLRDLARHIGRRHPDEPEAAP